MSHIIAIIGALFILATLFHSHSDKELNYNRVSLYLNILATALKLYFLDNGFYPTDEQGLLSLIKKPNLEPIPKKYRELGYINTLPQDPWGNEYKYINILINGTEFPLIWSLGDSDGIDHNISLWVSEPLRGGTQNSEKIVR